MKIKSIQSVKGTQDILPTEVHLWQKLERTIFQVMSKYSFKEIRTPAFEKTELFSRSVGEQTDIVSKEMYSWIDQGGDDLTLKPEVTAPVVRAFIQHNLGSISPSVKLYYIDALFRRERPQKGRYRQFHQFGAESFGSENPEADVEIIAVASSIFKSIGIKNIKLKINSIGSKICRDNYRDELRKFLKPHLRKLSDTSKVRFEKNPLRILDTKSPDEKALIIDAPNISDFLTSEDNSHFIEVKSFLKDIGIKFNIDHHLVRGLDYYNRTIFEFTSENIGSQDAICGGGRYDNLVKDLGGKDTPGVGFAAGIERILLALSSNEQIQNPDIYIVGFGNKAIKHVLICAEALRNNGFSVNTDLLRRSLKSQMKEANKTRAKTAILIGDKEIEQKKLQIKNLEDGKQYDIPFDSLVQHFKSL